MSFLIKNKIFVKTIFLPLLQLQFIFFKSESTTQLLLE